LDAIMLAPTRELVSRLNQRAQDHRVAGKIVPRGQSNLVLAYPDQIPPPAQAASAKANTPTIPSKTLASIERTFMTTLLVSFRPGWPQEERHGSAAISTSVESLIDVLIAGAHAPRGDLASCGEDERAVHVALQDVERGQ
jgi:hypothetical protein